MDDCHFFYKVLYRHVDDWLFVRQHNIGMWMIVVFCVVACYRHVDDCGCL